MASQLLYTRNTLVALTVQLISIFKHTETILPKKNYISSMVYLLYTMACMFPQCPHFLWKSHCPFYIYKWCIWHSWASNYFLSSSHRRTIPMEKCFLWFMECLRKLSWCLDNIHEAFTVPLKYRCPLYTLVLVCA